jgi:hypothetical protein
VVPQPKRKQGQPDSTHQIHGAHLQAKRKVPVQQLYVPGTGRGGRKINRAKLGTKYAGKTVKTAWYDP